MRILRIQHCENKGNYALVHVLMEDGTEATVWVGGECEVFFDKEKVKAFVRKTPKGIDL